MYINLGSESYNGCYFEHGGIFIMMIWEQKLRGIIIINLFF
jgi:hypothetical protein